MLKSWGSNTELRSELKDDLFQNLKPIWTRGLVFSSLTSLLHWTLFHLFFHHKKLWLSCINPLCGFTSVMPSECCPPFITVMAAQISCQALRACLCLGMTTSMWKWCFHIWRLQNDSRERESCSGFIWENKQRTWWKSNSFSEITTLKKLFPLVKASWKTEIVFYCKMY